ncbi:DUF3293 domain-containing protein [Coralloluteibacterium stylophorae]|uniref:DUF3293 domain-containing protein n=1 Tax=Coralloluteibacterium stylophorae TaxID=1776034 RepID=A0AAP2CBT3_9GAMM|nr:DUF3293 domain-containing protein [Coralloluteibacterium stylophorae]MBS7457550.1 DUF3293 domain-containing protein [Coralloluteibacterium stylophorae]
MSLDPDLLRAFRVARYRVCAAGRPRIHVGRRAPAVEALAADAQAFGFITACNPDGRRRGRASNVRDDAALAAALRAAGFDLHRAIAGDVAGRWNEAGWLVAATDAHDAFARLDALALRFGQLGVLAWRRGGRVRLRIHARAPAGLPPACVDAVPRCR